MSNPLPPSDSAHHAGVVRAVEVFGAAEALADFAAQVVPDLAIRRVCQQPGSCTLQWDEMPAERVVDVAALSARYPTLRIIETRPR